MSRSLMKIMILSTMLSFAGCAVQPDATLASIANEKTLYEELGSEAGVSAIVDGLLARIAKDTRIVHHFEETDIALFRERLIEHFCLVADGGCAYQGESMENSHQGLNITQADFDALVGHLIESLKALRIPLSVRNDLLKRLAPMYAEITYH